MKEHPTHSPGRDDAAAPTSGDGHERMTQSDDTRTEAASAPAQHPARPVAPIAGVNVVGFFRAEFGQGEVARRLVAGLERASIPVATVTYDRVPHRQAHGFVERTRGDKRYEATILCLNAEHLLGYAEAAPPELLDAGYTIGVWFWEASRFPEWLHPAFDFVDEIWVASDFVAEVLSVNTAKPVLTFPLPIEAPPAPPLSRKELGLPSDRFVFLFVFDFYSTIERKNPLGLVEAFKRAFQEGDEAVLVLKTINGDKKPEALARLRAAVDGHPGIRIQEGYLPSDHVTALVAACDCYVSLHRSEGFGINLAEAMAYGKPVIATAYSGNLAFMSEENSYLIPYELTTVPDGCPPYPPGAQWADPDVDEAARAMRQVVEAPEEARERAERGRATVATRLSPARTAEFLAARLGQIEPVRKERHAVSAEIRRAEAYLRSGPSISWDSPSPLGRPGLLARRIVRRLLRPYLIRHREFESSLVAALRTLERANRKQQELLQRRADQIHRLEHDLRETVREGKFLSLERDVQHLRDELFAAPYVADPELLRTTDAEGREAIGYASGGDGPEGSPYRSFEEIFRGPEERIRELQRPYLDVIGDRSPVLDVGCGRGEFLDLLAEAGIPAEGVDIDPGMVARCREKGHPVELADGISYLESHPDGRLGVVFAAHVIEHLSYADLLRFLEAARAKLAPAGVLVVETVNPHALPGFKTFWTDPSHRSPIFPEVAVALCRSFAFASARVIFPGGTGDLENDRRTRTEYAVVATSPNDG